MKRFTWGMTLPARIFLLIVIGLFLAIHHPFAQHTRQGESVLGCYETYSRNLNNSWRDYDQCFRDTVSWPTLRKIGARTHCRFVWMSNAIQFEAEYVACQGFGRFR